MHTRSGSYNPEHGRRTQNLIGNMHEAKVREIGNEHDSQVTEQEQSSTKTIILCML